MKSHRIPPDPLLTGAALPNVRGFKPCESADPAIYQLLLEAHRAGVGLRSIGMVYDPADSLVHLFNSDLPVDLS